MPVSIKGSGGGGVTIDAGAAASATTLTLPNVSGTVLQSGTAVTVAQGGTGLTTLTAANNALYSTSSSAITAGTLPVAAGGTGAATLTTNNVLLGNGTSALQTIAPGTSGNVLVSNGTTWASAAPSGGITSGTAVASTSGTSIDFTGIPATAKQITVMFNGVSTNGSSNKIVQIGAGSVTTSGYLGSCGVHVTGAAVTSITTGFGIATLAATDTFYGSMIIETLGSNVWQATVSGGLGNMACTFTGGGGVTLSGALDRVRITTVAGTDTFDAGSINILYQ